MRSGWVSSIPATSTAPVVACRMGRLALTGAASSRLSPGESICSGVQVFAYAQESRLTQQAVARAFDVLDLDDQRGLHPVHAAQSGQRCTREQKAIAAISCRCSSRVQLLELAVAEAGAQPPRIFQASIAQAAEQQRAEAVARAGGRRIAADHELGVLGAFHLEPQLAPAAAIRGIGALGNDPLQSEGASLLEEIGPLTPDMIRIAQDSARAGRVTRSLQQLLPAPACARAAAAQRGRGRPDKADRRADSSGARSACGSAHPAARESCWRRLP